jgi:hypothetical protein
MQLQADEGVLLSDGSPDGAVSGSAPKKMPANSLTLQFAGDLVLVKRPEKSLLGFFRRFETMFEACANADKTERLLRYKMLTALILTSYAKKEVNRPRRREIFELKNNLYFDIANSESYRLLVGFKYLVSKNFRIVQYCPSCSEDNKDTDLPKHKWKFCNKCTLDRNFYNVLSMHHRFTGGSFTLFLSDDLIDKVKIRTPKKKTGKLDDVKEEGKLGNFSYNVKNLDAISFESTMKLYQKVIGR